MMLIMACRGNFPNFRAQLAVRSGAQFCARFGARFGRRLNGRVNSAGPGSWARILDPNQQRKLFKLPWGRWLRWAVERGDT